MCDKPLIYIIGGSIRNRVDQEYIVENVKKIKSEAFLYEYLENVGRAKKISNSEGCAIAAAFGALQRNVDVRYLKLKRYFLRNGKTRNIKRLCETLEEADGIVFALPVYFGDRSSLFQEFIENRDIRKIDFSDKVFGLISVGAKRNGGQETTNIFGMQSVTELGGLVVGNGPPTSQFGGTAVGGNIGTMVDDYFGIMTSQGTGKRVAETAEILKIGKSMSTNHNKKIKITFLILQECDSILEAHIESIIKNSDYENVDFNIINLTNYNFNRCYACNVCPNGDHNRDYKCINSKDDMKSIHKELINSDGIILAGLCLKDIDKIKSVYQRFIERTRYIRRDNFRLTNILCMALSLNEFGTNCLFNLRVTTSFIRHNTIIHKGIHNYYYEGKIIDCGSLSIFKSFIEHSRFISIGREKVDIEPAIYAPVGYL